MGHDTAGQGQGHRQGHRLWQRLMELAAIGATPAGGVDRQALTDGEADAWRLLADWARAAGMEPSSDPAGNLFLCLPGRDRALPPLLAGSHIDTQPTGGRFDGAFGVLAALEAAVRLAEDGLVPARDLVVVAWMNEEGSRFAPGMMGSEAFAGRRPLPEILAATDAAGTTVRDALAALHAAVPDVPHRPLGFRPGFYLEAHIEQGPLLEAAGVPVGIVTGIQGKITWDVVLDGAEGHAGTLDMADRRDAVAAFARVAQAMFAAAATGFDAALKFTIGRVEVWPNAPSVVPGRVRFRVDLRHPEDAVLDAAATALEAAARTGAPPCAATLRRLVHAGATRFDPALLDLAEAAAFRLGHRSMRLLSAAGHDARHAAVLCPAAMIFIPCRGGESHVEHEWADPADVLAGAAVLDATIRDLVGVD